MILIIFIIFAGAQVEGSIDVNINADGSNEETVQAKEKPIWLSDATSLITTNITTSDTSNSQVRMIPSYFTGVLFPLLLKYAIFSACVYLFIWGILWHGTINITLKETVLLKAHKHDPYQY